MRSFLKKSVLNIVIWLLIFPMTTLSSDEFIVKDIKIEGLEKISEGALLNYLPLLFIPVGVGVVMHLSLLEENLVPVLLVIIIGTLLTLALTGFLMEKLVKKDDKHD